MQTGVANNEAVIISAFLYESFSFATTLGGIMSSKTKSLETPENSWLILILYDNPCLTTVHIGPNVLPIWTFLKSEFT